MIIELSITFLLALLWYQRYSKNFIIIQSAKILLLPPKYELIMLPSNHSFFQYCDSNIGLFYIAPCKVINFNPFCILFAISSLLLFWWLFLSYRSSNYRDSDSCRSFSLLKAIAKRLQLLFANAFKSVNGEQYRKVQYYYRNIGKMTIFKG